MRLSGKVALVTGSSSGVGAALAQGLAADGATMIVHYHSNATGAEQTARAITRRGNRCLIVRADVGVAEQVDEMFGQIRREFGRLDILINNAGITLKKPFEDSDEEDWDRILDANLKSVFLCSRRAVELMEQGGAIVNISSSHAKITTFNFSIYAASKGGMESLTRAMAIELGPRGIRVNALRLGWIRVERDRLNANDPAFEQTCRRIPLCRPGEVDDVVPTAVHLCTPAAGFITGQIITIDGGHETVLNTAFCKGYVDGGART